VTSYKDQIDRKNLPRHIAVIMDGNGRWAKKKGALRIFGHRSAIQSVREVSEGCGELGVQYLTLYAFSTENWGRPKDEVEGLMELLVNTLRDELHTLHENRVRLLAIGDLSQLPPACQQNLRQAMESTAGNTGLTLIIALSYSGHWEILKALNAITREVAAGTLPPGRITEEIFERYLETRGIPHPELLIRTSGEMRISNFLLWQLAYSELYFTPTLWPDFRKENLYEAIWSYQHRERRFGKISEQVNPL
jgi:undecaprenyl diphosphate synthase